MTYTYEYPRPALTSDVAAFCVEQGELRGCLIRRGRAPHAGKHAFPGGFLNMDETCEQCARREFAEETGLTAGRLVLAGIFDAPDRDPRGRVVDVAYVTCLPPGLAPTHGDDAAGAAWEPVSHAPPLAFDHTEVLAAALNVLRRDTVEHGRLLLDLLPEEFTPGQARAASAAILGPGAASVAAADQVLTCPLVQALAPGLYRRRAGR